MLLNCVQDERLLSISNIISISQKSIKIANTCDEEVSNEGERQIMPLTRSLSFNSTDDKIADADTCDEEVSQEGIRIIQDDDIPDEGKINSTVQFSAKELLQIKIQKLLQSTDISTEELIQLLKELQKLSNNPQNNEEDNNILYQWHLKLSEVLQEIWNSMPWPVTFGVNIFSVYSGVALIIKVIGYAATYVFIPGFDLVLFGIINIF